ncbi:MAG TPA: fumarylacetoacetate hydrolase family protein [Puia sp.]|jgi:2-dehydro-3-deoxy-D-arabinonate dehydratase|nr:fumarylacetoacetate hydrolase family protein [Puia sp.]
MKLYKLRQGMIIEEDNQYFRLNHDWDNLTNRDNLFGYLRDLTGKAGKMTEEDASQLIKIELQPPVGQQEVWAAGVTYLRSREARMEESKQSGGADFYDKVYEAERPELFFKAIPQRIAGHRQEVYIRRDSTWNVPEPELTLFINSAGDIQAYTIGNDMSSRSIEGENPLYLPQAKVYEKSAALGPCLYVPENGIDPETKIEMTIRRDISVVFREDVSISRMKRQHTELAGYLFRECDFPQGVFLMTGTCIVPPPDFTLQQDDWVDIRIDKIGVLSNPVGYRQSRYPIL